MLFAKNMFVPIAVLSGQAVLVADGCGNFNLFKRQINYLLKIFQCVRERILRQNMSAQLSDVFGGICEIFQREVVNGGGFLSVQEREEFFHFFRVYQKRLFHFYCLNYCAGQRHCKHQFPLNLKIHCLLPV